MEKFRHFLLHCVFLLFAGIVRILSDKFRTKLGLFLGKLYFRVAKSRKRVAIENITKAKITENIAEINQIAIESFQNFAITLVEMIALKYMTDDEIKRKIKFEDPQQLIDIYKQGRGIIFLSAHYGNWELMAYSGKLWLDIDMLIIVKLLKNSFTDKFIDKLRTSNGNRTVDMKVSAREILRTLMNKKALALLADQSAQENLDIFVDFFGRKALTYTAPADLALKLNVPLTECFPERQKDGTYIIRQNLIDFSDLTYSRENVRILTERHVKVLEEQIRRKPGQWSWMHKRWKHSPNE